MNAGQSDSDILPEKLSSEAMGATLTVNKTEVKSSAAFELLIGLASIEYLPEESGLG